MVRLGFVIGTLLPVALLAVNLALGYGGILVTIGLLVGLGTGILLTPTAEDEAGSFSAGRPPAHGAPPHPPLDRRPSGGRFPLPPAPPPRCTTPRPPPAPSGC